MAVVQISKIQVRRGQKNQGSGLPQLASGEFGWAVDTRELYIGNGSVAEGAPAVGNTKVLTQYDDLFSLADTYIYREEDLQTGFDASQPTTRTLQERLDDRVSVKSFGAKGDGITDDTEAFQRALDQLYLVTSTPVVLHVPAGTYILSDTLYISTNASLLGEGKNKTRLLQTSTNKYVFQTTNSSSTPGDYDIDDSSTTTINQPKNIRVEGMTLEVGGSQTALLLQSCRDSLFKDLEIKGIWTQVSAPVNDDIAIRLNQLSGPVASDGNTFEDCIITKFSYGVISDWDINYNNWINCKFDVLSFGVIFGNDMSLGSEASGTSRGPSDSFFNNCLFSNINKNAVKITNGFRNVFEASSFIDAANEAGPDTQPQYPVIVVSKSTNKVINCYFSRTAALSSGSGITSIAYYPEVEGPAMWDYNIENSISFGRSANVRLFRLPNISNKSFEVDYTLVSENYEAMRSGTMHIVINGYTDEIEVSDSYDYVGDPSYTEAIGFTGYLADADSDASFDTVDIRVNSNMPIDDQTQIKYTVRSKNTDII